MVGSVQPPNWHQILAVYARYTFARFGCYILPTTVHQNQKNPEKKNGQSLKHGLEKKTRSKSLPKVGAKVQFPQGFQHEILVVFLKTSGMFKQNEQGELIH